MKKGNEDVKTFDDFSNQYWYNDGEKIMVGNDFKAIVAGDCQTLIPKEIIYGAPAKTWRLIVTVDDKLHLIKTSKQLK
jgi:hypothetical protein